LLEQVLRGAAAAALEVEAQFERDASLLVQLLAARRAAAAPAMTA
jgi:hypothetical protein